MQEIIKDFYEISIWEDILVEGNEELLSYFKEEKVAVIGANDHNSPELAYNPRFTEDVKGEHTLTFTMNGKYYDKELEEYIENPYIKLLTNERKVKLFYRDEWYDLLIKKVEENKKNYSYNYTATDLFINELGKNGFKVELNVELENNQGTAEELAAQILEGTDWKVSSYMDNTEYKSDLLVETNLDTLYKATLSKNIIVEVSADGWLPIREEDVEPAFGNQDNKNIKEILKGEEIYLFYSDLVAKNQEPMILYRADGDYRANENEDIIINSYNFRVTRENEVFYSDDNIPLPDFIDQKKGIVLEKEYRAYETVRRAETAYDPITDKFITYYFQRLYTREFVETEDKFPYSNKEYFTKKVIEGKDVYERFYDYTFIKDDTGDNYVYYELQYNEVLYDSELDKKTEYYVKTLVPEYTRLLEEESVDEIYYYDNDKFSYTKDNTNSPKYKKTNKMVDGYIKYEGKEWPRFKGYTETEYLSPTLVQNYLANSSEITNVDEGWLFDGAPSSGTRAGELVTRIDQDERYNFKENPASSMMVMHLTNKEMYYQSQTGNIIYTSYTDEQEGILTPTNQMKYKEFDVKYDEKALEDYLNYIFPGPDFQNYDYTNWEEDAKKELQLIYSFEYTENELDEYVKLIFELVSEVLNYTSDGRIISSLKLDLFGIKKRKLEKKINNLVVIGAQDKVQVQINEYLEDLKGMLNNDLSDIDTSELQEEIGWALNNIKSNEKKTVLNNIKVALSNKDWDSLKVEINPYIDENEKQIETDNKIFDQTIAFLIDFYKEVENKNLTITVKNLMASARAKVGEQIKQRFFEHISSRRYEANSRSALNSGIAGNRRTIQKLNKGEEYVLALSLGRYKETEEAPLYNKQQTVTYGDVEDKYYSFSNGSESGIGDYIIDVEDYKEVEETSAQGWMWPEGKYRIIDEFNNSIPIYYCIAQEIEAGKYITKFIPWDSEEQKREFYYPDSEGTYIYINPDLGKNYYDLKENYTDWKKLNRGGKRVLCQDNEFKIINGKNLNNAKTYRKSSTLICTKENEGMVWGGTGFLKDKIQLFTLNDLDNRGKYKQNKVLSLENKEGKYFSLYKSSDGVSELYCFTPDDNGDYVHVIKDENPLKEEVKWYEFWKNTDNINKFYRQFKEADEAAPSEYHYFKRYNSYMDYDYHPTSWQDGHIGPWRERYQRYTKNKIYLYSSTDLSPDYTYWVSTPFSDGSECYTLYSNEPVKRYYFSEGKPENTETNELVYDSINGTFSSAMEKEFIPVALYNKQYRVFEVEKDSQRVPVRILGMNEERLPNPDTDYVYCVSPNEFDLGYYRPCTKRDQILYTLWKTRESLDNAFGFYRFLKIKDTYNWNSDTPPFTFGVPIEVLNEDTETEGFNKGTWVKEIRKGESIIVPYDPILHSGKGKYYYRSITSTNETEEIYYHDSGVFKLFSSLAKENTTIPINYDDLKISFCEYDYNNSTYKITNKNKDEQFLEFDCSKPFEGYFDLEISPAMTMGDETIPAEKERYVWWKSPILRNYNLTEDYFKRIGILFHTESREIKNYPIISAQLFKYKTYKSNNYELLTKYRKQFYDYEQKDENNSFYSPTDEEVAKIKQAFQEYFGYEKWEEASGLLENKTYISYLEMLNAYFAKDEEKINYIKNRVSFSDGEYKISSDEKLLQYTQELGYYNSLDLSELLASSNLELANRLLSAVYSETLNSKSIMALPGEVPDNNDLILTNYFLYNPELSGQDDIDTLVYDYVGNDALSYYRYDYDELCQKVRGIETKEKNYLSALNSICEKFECWIKYELSHYTKEENEKLNVKDYENAHTPGEIKMVERSVWVSEDDMADIIFEPKSVFNTHISNKQNEAISAYDNFNPRDYWEKRKDYVEWDGHEWEEGVVYYEEDFSGNFKEVDKKQNPIPESEKIYYTYLEDANKTALENSKDVTYLKKKMMVPQKTIYLKQFTGDLNYAGFKYGINLKSIKRTLDSKDLVSRLIVKENTNEHAKDGFCTIQRAAENPIKENFILNFDYYVQHKILDKKELWEDLYGINNGYYSQLANINKKLDEIVIRTSEVAKTLDEVNANYETYSLARDAAQDEIDDMANLLSERLENYPVPWKYDMDKETIILKTSWSDGGTKTFEIKDNKGNVINSIWYVDEGQDRAIEIPKYNEDTRSKLVQMDIFQRKYEYYYGLAQKAEEQKEEYEQKLEELYAESDEMYRMKNNLNALFFKKYYRFMQEGSWKEDKYMDDTLYYLDALAVLRTSAFPKVTYDIQVIDLKTLKDYKGYSFKIGDKTYIEDTEFFGYTQSNKPYQEEVMITKIEYHLDDASKNKITISNYRTQFEDLFKRIAATVAKVELSTGGYNRANAVINETDLKAPLGSTETIQGTATTINGSVSLGREGLITTEIGFPSNKLKVFNGAVYRSIDGGNTYQKIISAKEGLNPGLIGNGRLDLTQLVIGAKDKPELTLTNNGLTAFQKNNENIDYSTFVRFDSYGMYGIKNYKRNSSTDDSSNATLNDSFVPDGIDSIYENATYGLTWNGFFLNTGDGIGRVSIGTNQDLRMSIKNDNNAWQDRIVIGKLQDSEETYYGFRIIDDNENIVLNTDDRGQLYLRHKLYISHFNDEYGTVTEKETIKDEYGTVTEKEVIKDKKLDQTNVTLGIVKAYKRLEDGNYESGKEIHDNYSSLDYLTKVFSVKSVVDGYDLKGALKDEKDYFKQFSIDQIATVIDPNENLAIFDNGNLYAKNAWIEGNIRAISGDIVGKLSVGEKGNIIIDGTEKRIHNNNETWSINNDGSAYFNNVKVSGTISSAVFSYDKIQTVGGALLVRPSYKVLSNKIEEVETETGTEKYLCLELDISTEASLIGFEEGDYCRIGHDFNLGGFFNAFYEVKEQVPPNEKKPHNVIKLILAKEDERDYSSIESVTSLKTKDKVSYGIGLNSTENDTILPPESLSLVEMSIQEGGGFSPIPKVVLGNLGILAPTETKYLKTDSKGQYYGLYADNVLLHGSLVVADKNYNAGITTAPILTTEGTDEFLMIWAGEQDKKPSFYVDRKGFLYAQNGLFEGQVISSTIKTSTIIGNTTAEGYGLTIVPEEEKTGEKSKAILFGSQEKKEDGTFKIKDKFFALDSQVMEASVNFKVTSKPKTAKNNNNKQITYNLGILNQAHNCVGLFGRGAGEQIGDYLLNFTVDNENEYIKLSYTGQEIATIDGSGIHTKQENSWGDSIYLEGLTEGCDIYVR